jgi:hypothetical protein
VNLAVSTKDLGLAAFMKANGALLMGHRQGTYLFRSERTVAAWRVDYSNSCCRQHDMELLELRRIARLGVPPVVLAKDGSGP